jgi:hypothetical protein
MDRDNVTHIEAHKLADLMIQEWISAYSDDGRLWEQDYDALQVIKSNVGDEIVEEAYQLAKARWDKMHGR